MSVEWIPKSLPHLCIPLFLLILSFKCNSEFITTLYDLWQEKNSETVTFFTCIYIYIYRHTHIYTPYMYISKRKLLPCYWQDKYFELKTREIRQKWNTTSYNKIWYNRRYPTGKKKVKGEDTEKWDWDMRGLFIFCLFFIANK